MVHETCFKAIVLGSFLVVGSGYLVVRILRKYPGTARAGFDSFDDVRGFYAFALAGIRDHKWLVTVPAVLVLSYYFIRIPGFLHGRSILESYGWAFESETVAVSLEGLLGAAVAAGRMLFGGHEVFFLGISPLVLILIPIILIRPSVLTRRLSLYAGGDDMRGFDFVRETVSVLRQILLYVGVPLIFSIILRQPRIIVCLIVAAGGLFRVTVILMLAIVTGGIMFYASRLVSGGPPDSRAALRGSLGITRSLFCLYLILTIPLSIDIIIPAALMFPLSVSTFFGVTVPEPVQLPPKLWLFLVVYWKYIAAFITAATACAPFMLLSGDRGVVGAFRANFDFIGRHFVKYLTFIGSGIFLLFLPELITVLLQSVIPYNTAAELVVTMITHTISVCLAVVFLLAALKFYHDYGGVTSDSRLAGGSRQA